MLPKYLPNNSVNLTSVRTPVHPANCLPHLFTLMVNLAVCGSFLPDGGKTTSGVCSLASVYPLTIVFTNYLTLVLLIGSLTPQTEDVLSSLVSSLENLVFYLISYSHSPALYKLSSGSRLCLFPLRLYPGPASPLWILPTHLLGIVTSFILYATL